MRDFSEEIREDTRQQDALKTALRMLKLGKNSLEDIVWISGLTADEVRALAERYGVPVPA